MKSLALVFILNLPDFLNAQGVFTNQTHTALQTVISDYPNRFRNIKGELISMEPQSSDYHSVVQIPGSINSVVTQYSSSADEEIYSWKCVLFESEDFDTVSQKYKELYHQIRNSIIKIDGQKPFILNGTYEPPTEDKRFMTSVFYLLPASGDLSKLKVELSLQYFVTEWKVTLLVYDQEEERFVME